jgi:hypothetical protein
MGSFFFLLAAREKGMPVAGSNRELRGVMHMHWAQRYNASGEVDKALAHLWRWRTSGARLSLAMWQASARGRARGSSRRVDASPIAIVCSPNEDFGGKFFFSF